jgi:hypothetical protein
MHNKIVLNSISHEQNAWGGGIGTYPVLHDLHQILIENNFIASNTINGSVKSRGGGICLIQGKIRHNTIQLNLCSSVSSTSVGGGIFSYSDTTFHRALVVIADNTITHNHVESIQNASYGGGVDIQMSNVQLLRNTIRHNTTSGGYLCGGAGIRLRLTNKITMAQDNTISFNQGLSDCVGGGIYAHDTHDLTIQNNLFEHNEGTTGGGLCIFATNGTFITHNTFLNNHSSFGGAIFDQESIGSTIESNRIKHNTADIDGGGIFIYDCSPAIYNNLIKNNQAVYSGGGIYIGDQNSQAQIINNTIIADSAGMYGGGICANLVSPVVMNTIVWENHAPNGGQVYTIGGNTSIVYCDIQEDTVWTGMGNKNLNPDLIGDSLSSTSPCIGAGIDVYDFGEGMICYCPPQDINGRNRPSPEGTKPDMGAWEEAFVAQIELQPGAEIIQSYILHQNYPNPFNPLTVIKYQLPMTNDVELTVYNLLGQKVATLVSEMQTSGYHRAEWDASGFACGTYFYRIKAGIYQDVRRMVLLR